MSKDLPTILNCCVFSSITRLCFFLSRNCSAKLISKVFFSRLVHSLVFSGRGLIADLRNRESDVLHSETRYSTSEVDVDFGKEHIRDREGKMRKEEKIENEGDGQIDLMLYNGSDSLWILAWIDNLIMQPSQGPSSESFSLVFTLVTSLLSVVGRTLSVVDECVHKLTRPYFFADPLSVQTFTNIKKFARSQL